MSETREQELAGIVTEARQYLDRATAIFAYVDGQEDPSGGDRSIDAMRREFNEAVAIVRGAMKRVNDHLGSEDTAEPTEYFAEGLELLLSAIELGNFADAREILDRLERLHAERKERK